MFKQINNNKNQPTKKQKIIYREFKVSFGQSFFFFVSFLLTNRLNRPRVVTLNGF